MTRRRNCDCDREEGALTRRQLLQRSGLGFGHLALTYLLGNQFIRAEGSSMAPRILFNDLKPRKGTSPARAKAVIQLMQNGGPSQMDLFDPKPELNKLSGKPYPGEVETFQLGNKNILLGSSFQFKKHGQSGMDMSEILPHLGGVADDLCMVRSMYTEHNNHPEGLTMIQTGKIFPGRPALGSWVSYALGTENQNLPAYVVLRDPSGYSTSGKMVWSSGWLPALYQGVEFSSSGTPVHHLSPSHPMPPGAQRDNLDLLASMNAEHKQMHPRETELEARIQNYELAARMQLAAAEILDLSKESEETKKLYGLDNPVTAGYGTRCLMARRLVESGVRFVQIFPPLTPSTQPWDNHNNLKNDLQAICAHTDQPSAALIRDLKGRGLLGETIVMWTGEFGRLPITENENGRDHNRHAFTLLLAGGGFNGGLTYGATDEFGYKAVENRVSVPDLHATLLHSLGLDHERLTYPYQGREDSLTDAPITGAKVVKALLTSRAKA